MSLPQTPEERAAYSAKKSKEWYHSPAGQKYQLVVRERLFNPDWKVKKRIKTGAEIKGGVSVWKFEEDVAIARRDASDRELARDFAVTMPALRQRRVRLRRLLSTAKLHHKVAEEQIQYAGKLRLAFSK